MDGLECTELLFSELENSMTLGAEYYSKAFMSVVNNVKKFSHTTLSSASKLITDGDHGAAEYQEKGVLYLLSECIKPGYIDVSKARFITEQKHKELKRSALYPRNVVVTKTGVNFGISAVIPDDYDECNTIAHVGKIELKQEYNPYIVSSFLNSKYGYYQMRRRGLKATRPEMKLVEMQGILIPNFNSDALGDIIEQTIELAYNYMQNAKITYKQAEELLLNVIGIDMSTVSDGGVSVKSFSESFGKTGRLDAEYYRPKYDELIRLLKTTDCFELNELVNITKSIEPGSDAYQDNGIPFIRISDISTQGLSTPEKYLEIGGKYDLPEYYLKKNEILFSKDGSVGIAYKIEADMKAITSGALLHLTVKDELKLLPDYLTMVLNSKIVKEQAEREAGGSIIQHWKPSEIEKIFIPVLDMKLQKKISDKVIKSFTLKQKSDALLKAAIKSVEMAIEQNEDIATAWLGKQIKEITGDNMP